MRQITIKVKKCDSESCPFNKFSSEWMDFECILSNEFIPDRNLNDEFSKDGFPQFCKLKNIRKCKN